MGEKAKTEKYSHEVLHSSSSKNTALYGRKVTTVLSEWRAAALACYKRLIINVSLLLFSQSSSTCALLEKELLGSTSGIGMFYFCLQEGFPLLVPVQLIFILTESLFACVSQKASMAIPTLQKPTQIYS